MKDELVDPSIEKMLKQIVSEADDIPRATHNTETQPVHHALQIRRGADEVGSVAKKLPEALRRQNDLHCQASGRPMNSAPQ